MIDNAFAHLGGQVLDARLFALNASALRAARRAAADPDLPSRIRFPEEGQAANYAKLAVDGIEVLSRVGFFLFRPTSIADALSYKPTPIEPPDNELVRRFLLLGREFSRHNSGTPVAMLGLRVSDREVVNRLNDNDFEAIQGTAALCFEPRFVPILGETTTESGWKMQELVNELITDLARDRLRVLKARPVKTLERA